MNDDLMPPAARAVTPTAAAPASPESPLPDGLARPARRALAAAGVTTIGHLATCREDEVRLMHGMGPKALAVLRRALDDCGLAFAHP